MYFEPELRFLQEDAIEVVALKQGFILPHQHAFFELAYILDGQANHILNGKGMRVKRGDYFIVNYDEEHQYTLIDNQPFDLINILFKAELLDKSFKDCKDFQQLLNHYLIQINASLLTQKPTHMIFSDTDGAILRLIREIEKEYKNQSNGYIALIRCYIIEIIIRTLRTICKSPHQEKDDGLTNYIKDYIEKNYMYPITLSEISRKLHFSLPYLSYRFKQDTGFTFVNYLQNKRMENSSRLLANTDKKIAEIAEQSGYTDVKFFNAVFKKHWGVTPSAFRKSYK